MLAGLLILLIKVKRTFLNWATDSFLLDIHFQYWLADLLILLTVLFHPYASSTCLQLSAIRNGSSVIYLCIFCLYQRQQGSKFCIQQFNFYQVTSSLQTILHCSYLSSPFPLVLYPHQFISFLLPAVPVNLLQWTSPKNWTSVGIPPTKISILSALAPIQLFYSYSHV